jgi:hypothetical protein
LSEREGVSESEYGTFKVCQSIQSRQNISP